MEPQLPPLSEAPFADAGVCASSARHRLWGGTFCRFVERSGRIVTGVDVDRGVLPSSADRARYTVGAAEALPFRTGSFDVVTMVAVLHHVDTTRAAC